MLHYHMYTVSSMKTDVVPVSMIGQILLTIWLKPFRNKNLTILYSTFCSDNLYDVNEISASPLLDG